MSLNVVMSRRYWGQKLGADQRLLFIVALGGRLQAVSKGLAPRALLRLRRTPPCAVGEVLAQAREIVIGRDPLQAHARLLRHPPRPDVLGHHQRDDLVQPKAAKSVCEYGNSGFRSVAVAPKSLAHSDRRGSTSGPLPSAG